MKSTTKIIIDSLLVIPISILVYLLLLGITAGTFESLVMGIIIWTLVIGFFIRIPVLFGSNFIIMYLWRRFGPVKYNRIISLLFAAIANVLILYFFFI